MELRNGERTLSEEDLRINGGHGYEPVSYTHLDVYKRQVFYPRAGLTGHTPSMVSYPGLVSSYPDTASVYRLSSDPSSVSIPLSIY